MTDKTREFVEYLRGHPEPSAIEHIEDLWGQLTPQEQEEVISEKATSHCDACNKKIRRADGYLLSTKEVVMSVACWKRFLSKSEVIIPNLLKDSEVFVGLVAFRASSDTPWQVCEECSAMFSFDRTIAKVKLLRNRITGEFIGGFGLCTVSRVGKDTIVDPIDADSFDAALKAAGEALDSIMKNRQQL